MLSAGGQVPTQTLAPASKSALAMAKPYPASSATPATSARFPVKSIASMHAVSQGAGAIASGAGSSSRCERVVERGGDPQQAGGELLGERRLRRVGRRRAASLSGRVVGVPDQLGEPARPRRLPAELAQALRAARDALGEPPEAGVLPRLPGQRRLTGRKAPAPRAEVTPPASPP